ncbi:vesicle-associated protein 1-3-like [Nymphaea colorata]|nr:vesicle-associated protein 1-3-like [Nymphaea colorata]
MISNHLVTAKDIIAEMFNKEAGKVVDECKMDVVYLYPPQPPSPVPEESEEGSSPRASSQLDNGGCSSSTYDSVPKASDESKEKHREVLNKISMLAMERTSASELNQKLRQELDLLRE